MKNKVSRLQSIGSDLVSNPNFSNTNGKAALICINNYVGTRLDLGNGPLNDGYYIAKTVKEFGYDIYYMINPRKSTFLNFLGRFLESIEKQLVVFYVGHGTRTADISGDETDGFDEAMVFVDGNLVDDTLVETLENFKNRSSRVILITDACHSGSIWDIQGASIKGRRIPPNIMSISAANDSQTAKQTFLEKEDQGIFSYNFRKTVKSSSNISANELKKQMTTQLRKFGQTVTLAESFPGMTSEPIFSQF